MATDALLARQADALLDVAECVRQHPFAAIGEIDDLALRGLSRATDTVTAIAVLVKQELPDQAQLLCRALFEDAVVILWLTVNPDPESVLARSEKHASLWEAKIKSGVLEDEPGVRWEGSSHWTGESLHTLLRQIEEWTRDDEALSDIGASLRESYRGSLKLTQAFVHNSTFTMRPWQLAWQSDEVASAWESRIDVSVGESALHGAHSYFLIAVLAATIQIADDESEENAALAALIHAPAWRRFQVRMYQHERVGRNDPCPCGSGLKFKRCCGE